MRAHRIGPGEALRTAGAALAALALVSCNSTMDNGGNGTVTTASPVGVWVGSDSVSGLDVTAYVNSAGQATFIRSDGVQFDGACRSRAATWRRP